VIAIGTDGKMGQPFKNTLKHIGHTFLYIKLANLIDQNLKNRVTINSAMACLVHSLFKVVTQPAIFTAVL
jgi:hypothetical protein